jgi:hypothetical protein
LRFSNRQLDREAKLPFVLALIVLVAGIEMEIRILLRDFELKRRLARRVVRKRGEDIRATCNALTPRLCGKQRRIGRFVQIETELNAFNRAQWQSESLGDSSPRLERKPVGLGKITLQFHPGDPRRDHIRRGRRARREPLFQQPDKLFLNRGILPQQCNTPIRRRMIHQRGANRTAHLPRRSRDVQSRRFRKVLSACAMRKPRLPAVSIGTSSVTLGNHGEMPRGGFAL